MSKKDKMYQNSLWVFICILACFLFIPTIAQDIEENLCKAEKKNIWTSPARERLVERSITYRLPKSIIPKNYNIFLKPNFTSKTFSGVVTITIEVLQPSYNITLHTNKLVILSAAVTDVVRNQSIVVEATEHSNDKREFQQIYLSQILEPGEYALTMYYSGNLNKTFVGLYSSTLKSGRSMVASKFQPTYARQAFPCFDEPEYKATFDISLEKPSSYVALSNMPPVQTTTSSSESEIVQFATSVPMSTYLACFVICDFTYKEEQIDSHGIGPNFILRSYAQKDQTHKIDFAQDIGKRSTEFYIQYYDVPFPLPKLDMIAIPDYVSGATEHWGLITYRETSFLVDPATASASNKISVANTIAHELAHMWFGNLVTMKWWDEIWLNEGFASYMQAKAINAIEPSWTMLDQFLPRTLHSVLVTDAKLSSHPIVQTVETPDQITAIFDSISYQKGASILRMLEGFVGEENFRRGVSDYLKKHQYGNTVQTDLLAALEPYFKVNSPDLNLTYILDTWTKQMGYPLVKVTRGDKPNSYDITQSRFLLDPDTSYEDDSPFSYRWFVPITIKTNRGTNENIVWFPDTAEKVTIELEAEDEWIKVNNNQVGYYRVTYDDEMIVKLTDVLKSNTKMLTLSDRSHLLDDVFALAEAQQQSYELALNLTTYLNVEEDYVPWKTARTIFSGLAGRVLNTGVHDKLMKYVQELITPIYIKQNWKVKPSSVIDGLLRTQILSMATKFQLPDAVNMVRSMFLDFLNNGKKVETDLRDLVYFYGMTQSTMEEWDKLWQVYLKETDVQEQSKLRHALSAPRDAAILNKYLTLAWDEKNIRSQDYLNVIHYISANPHGTAIVWNDVRSRWSQLVDRFSLNSRYLGNTIPVITNSFDTEIRLKEMECFFAANPEAGAGETARKRALETLRNNIRWRENNMATVSEWLNKRVAE